MLPSQRIIHLLSGPAVSRIRFSFPNSWGGRLAISAASFQRVVTAIKHRKITTEMTDDLPADAAGQYDQKENNFELHAITGRLPEGTIVHESVHAFFDISRTHVTANDNEAAAYVAEGLFWKMTGLPPSRWNDALHVAGGKVATGLLHHYALGKVPVPPVDDTAWQALKFAISTDATYNKTWNGPAGFIGTLLGGDYGQDG